ncbi:MAG: response regulator transcription factor [Chloroflexota bacterium]
MMIRVFVVDDHPVVRHGITSMLRWEKGLEVVGDAEDGLEAIQGILDVEPDVVLLDLRLPTLSGIEVMQRVRSQKPNVRFLVLTTYDTDQYIGLALAAGAKGYLLKDATPDELSRGIHSLMQGGAALEPSVAARLLRMNDQDSSHEELSQREIAVLELLVNGASNKAIAAHLTLSENTIKTHISRIFAKLGVQSRTEAASVALQRGLVNMGQMS